jgi:hypothetical protein
MSQLSAVASTSATTVANDMEVDKLDKLEQEFQDLKEVRCGETEHRRSFVVYLFVHIVCVWAGLFRFCKLFSSIRLRSHAL